MVFNKALPSGQKAIALLDDDVRENNDALQPAFNQEHRFVDNDGVQQDGIHTFPVGGLVSLPSRNVEGGLAIENVIDVRGTLYWHDGTNWLPLVNEDPNAAHTDRSETWGPTQISDWVSIAPAAALLTVDPLAGAYQETTLDQDVTLSISALPLATTAAVVTLNVNAGVGPYSITWDPQFRAQGGVIQYAEATNADTLFIFTSRGSDTWLVTSVPNWNVGGVTSVGA